MRTLAEAIIGLDSVLRQVIGLIGSQSAEEVERQSLQKVKKTLLEIRYFLMMMTKQQVNNTELGVREKIEIVAFVIAILRMKII